MSNAKALQPLQELTALKYGTCTIYSLLYYPLTTLCKILTRISLSLSK